MKLAASVVARRIKRMRASPVLMYYKCNHCELFGVGQERFIRTRKQTP